jgi:hypothetical protein
MPPSTYVFSTHRRNADAWLPILSAGVKGTWTLALPNTPATTSLFQNEQIQDILFAVTCSGKTPA